MNGRQKSLKELFKTLFWPAAAGSVFWSFCTILTRTDSLLTKPETLSSLIILLLLSTYLSLGWLMSYENIPSALPAKFWIFDCIHVCAIIFAALSATQNIPLLTKTSIFFFAATALGHLIGAWELEDPKKKDRYWLTIINLSGVIIILLGDQISLDVWPLPSSYAVVISLWLIFRHSEVKELFKK